jgi:hypothetical protein
MQPPCQATKSKKTKKNQSVLVSSSRVLPVAAHILQHILSEHSTIYLNLLYKLLLQHVQHMCCSKQAVK